MSNKHKFPFGEKAVGLLSNLTTTIQSLKDLGYFNDAQHIFIEHYAFKCDGALAAAAGYVVDVTKICSPQADDLTDNSSSTVLETSASTIKLEPLETTTPVLIDGTSTTSLAVKLEPLETGTPVFVEGAPTTSSDVKLESIETTTPALVKGISTTSDTAELEPLETTTPVLIEGTSATSSTNAICNDDTTSGVVVKPILSESFINAIQRDEKVINNFFTASPLATPGCGLKEEFMSAPTQVEKGITSNEQPGQKLDVKSQVLPKIPVGPKIENRRPNRSHGMVVRFIEGGPKNGKRNISLLARVSTPYGSQNQQHEWVTTRHYPGTVIMARENQQGTPDEAMMPFLNIQRGDLLILKEERSPNIYLVKQNGDKGLEGLIRIYRTDMKAADAAATSIQGDDSQSEKSGSKSSRENSPISRGRTQAGALKDKTNISGKPSSSKSPTTVAIKPAINSAPPKVSTEVKAPRVPAPGFENAPHMIAARMYDEDANRVPETYNEGPLPKRTRYVDIWTPHLTDGCVIEPGSW